MPAAVCAARWDRPNSKYELEVYLSNEPSLAAPIDSVLVRTAVEIMEWDFRRGRSRAEKAMRPMTPTPFADMASKRLNVG